MKRVLFIFLFDQERDVVVAASERDHPNGDISHGIERMGFEPHIAPFQIAHYADDAHLPIDGYRAVFLQVVDNFVQMGYTTQIGRASCRERV